MDSSLSPPKDRNPPLLCEEGEAQTSKKGPSGNQGNSQVLTSKKEFTGEQVANR